MPESSGLSTQSHLTVVGLGLIGGSFALAARNQFASIRGIEPNEAHARKGLDLGIADEIVDDVSHSMDAVLLACPSDQIASWVENLRDHQGTVFDAGSVKGALFEEILQRTGEIPDNFVGCHPIAGQERSGPQAADADLFRNRMVVVTPTPRTDLQRLERVSGWWRATGASVLEMDPHKHDETYALTSHLPHLLAFAYLQAIEEPHLSHAGGGFRDFSRIGGSDPDMWSAIFEMNKAALLPVLDRFGEDLALFRSAIEQGNQDAMRQLIAFARSVRSGYEDG